MNIIAMEEEKSKGILYSGISAEFNIEKVIECYKQCISLDKVDKTQEIDTLGRGTGDRNKRFSSIPPYKRRSAAAASRSMSEDAQANTKRRSSIKEMIVDNLSCCTRRCTMICKHPKISPSEASKNNEDEYESVIVLHHYIKAFRELMKFLESFGTVMSFAVKSLKDTIEELEFHMHGDAGKFYVQVEGMIKYEVKSKLVQRKIKGKDSGTKCLLLLHRSVAFIMEFLKALRNVKPKAKSWQIAQHAYDRTLAQYHSWLINKMAGLAFSSLPPVKEIISTLTSKRLEERQSILTRLLESLEPVYTTIQNIYAKYYLLKCA